jgi:hypothetical protein
LCVVVRVFLAGLFLFLFFFLMPDLRTSADFCYTRAPQPSSPSPSAPAAGRTAHAVCRRTARSLHAPESPLLFGARDGHVPRFSGLARWGWGLRRLIFGWVVLVMARVSHAPSSPAESACRHCDGFSCLGLLLRFT